MWATSIALASAAVAVSDSHRVALRTVKSRCCSRVKSCSMMRHRPARLVLPCCVLATHSAALLDFARAEHATRLIPGGNGQPEPTGLEPPRTRVDLGKVRRSRVLTGTARPRWRDD
jgi:hypothetical protein